MQWRWRQTTPSNKYPHKKRRNKKDVISLEKFSSYLGDQRNSKKKKHDIGMGLGFVLEGDKGKEPRPFSAKST